MAHRYKLLIFYGALALAAFDMHALARRFFLAAPDPVAWDKLALAALLQAVVFALAWPYLTFVSRMKASLLERQPSFFFSLHLWLAPILGLGLLAGFSVMVLYNSFNCGNHPLPTNRGALVCPR
jgi:hypothetical protein